MRDSFRRDTVIVAAVVVAAVAGMAAYRLTRVKAVDQAQPAQPARPHASYDMDRELGRRIDVLAERMCHCTEHLCAGEVDRDLSAWRLQVGLDGNRSTSMLTSADREHYFATLSHYRACQMTARSH